MPLKLNIGLSKKLGQPDYGSLGASCHVEVELEASLLRSDLDGFHRQVRTAFIACSQAVNDELSRQSERRDVASGASTHNHSPSSHGNGNGHNQNNGSGNGNGHQASDKQFNYARRLASQIPNLGRLELLVDQMFGKAINELTGFEASSLIDQLKAMKDGQVAIPNTPDGVPA